MSRRGIKSVNSPLFVVFAAYYNFIRPHMSLDVRTPAEAAGITIGGMNKWRTLVGNALLAARAAGA